MLSEELEEMLSLLGKKVCRAILRYLGSKKRASFSELKKELDLSSGALSYNLSLLKGLVAKDEEGAYYLTAKGKLAFSALTMLEEGLLRSRSYGLKSIRSLLAFFYAHPAQSSSVILAILIAGTWLISSSGLRVLGLFVTTYLGPTELAPLTFPASWAFIYAVAATSSRVLFNVRGGWLKLAIGVAISMLPLLALQVLWLILSWSSPAHAALACEVAMYMVAAISLTILVHAISMAGGLRIERASLVALCVLYANLVLLMVLVPTPPF